MANPHNLELEAAKFLQRLFQESKDEPTTLAAKLYVILQHMRASGKENSMPYQVISMAMETVIKQNGLDIEALTSSRLPNVAGTQVGESGASQGAAEASKVSQLVTGPRNRVTTRTLDQEYGINRNILEQHSGKKLEDVAEILGVSRSTLKRICRKYHIFRWPPYKAKKGKHSLQKLRQPSTQRKPPDFEPRRMGADGRIMVKATYGDDIFKFQLSGSSTKLDLEKEISVRLKLSVGSFKIKYLDEDNDWVSIACDADLRICITTLTSMGRRTIKMRVDQI